MVIATCIVLALTFNQIPFGPGGDRQPLAESSAGDDSLPSDTPRQDSATRDAQGESLPADDDNPDPNAAASDAGSADLSDAANDSDSVDESAGENIETTNESSLPDAGSPVSSPRRRRPAGERAPRKSQAAVLAELNDQLQNAWEFAQITPAPAVSDETWCERAFQHLLGRSPHPQELREFRATAATDKRAEWTDRLLGPQYTEEFATHWGHLWAEWLLDARAMPDSQVVVFRTGLKQYLKNVIARDSHFDDIMLSLLVAQGSNDNGAPDYNPATNYMLAIVDEQGANATTHICRVLLGRRMECAQCHNDPLTDLSQERFWQLTAAIKPLKKEVLRPGRGRLRDLFASQMPEVQYQQPDGRMATVQPALPDGKPLQLAEGETPREHLAERLVASPQMARATVNRVWKHMLRYGFTLPVDDMGRHNPVSHPAMLDLMATQFAAHQYDLKHLMRWIVLSDAFDRSDVVTVGNSKDFPDGGSVALFSRYYHRPVLFRQPEEAMSWLAQGRVPQVTSTETEEDRLMIAGRRNQDLASQPGDATAFGANNPMGQLLTSTQLHLVRSLTNPGKLTPAQQLEHAFRVVLGRAPTAEELQRGESIYQAADGNAVVALERVFWALMNTGRI
jgi:hypothetical protein